MIGSEVFERTLLGFLQPVRSWLEDPEVSEILINGHRQVFVEKKGQLQRTDAAFVDEESLYVAIRNLAQYVGRSIGPQQPILEGRLPDGSRIEAVVPPASPTGPHLAIRRFHRDTLSVEKLLQSGSVDRPTLDFLIEQVRQHSNILVAGGTGSGKTSLLNLLSSFIAASERTIVLEDARELQLRQPHVVCLEAQPGDATGRGRVSVRELFRASLRLRPDRLVVGEIRGSEAIELIQAMISGHRGCLSTVHASSPHDALHRLETMALMSDVALPLPALRAQLASAIDLIVQVERCHDGRRRVCEVSQIDGYDDAKGYQLLRRHP